MALDPMAQDPEAEAPEAPEATGAGGMMIEIKVSADGTMSVGVEPQAEEDQEEGGGEDGEYQPVASLPELFKLIGQIIKGGGQPSASDQGEMDAAYEARQ